MEPKRRRGATPGILAVLAAGWLATPAMAQTTAPTGTSECHANTDVDVGQNWTRRQSRDFWWGPQGSRIMPWSWFIALEQPAATTGRSGGAPQGPDDPRPPFTDACFMQRFGLITVRGTSMAIGISKEPNRTGTSTFAGLTCAACHTGLLAIGNRTVLIEGGQSRFDFQSFFAALIVAIEETSADPNSARFKRWYDRVGDTTSTPDQLIERLRNQLTELRQRQTQNTPAHRYGFGRVDAFGQIFNRLFETVIAGGQGNRTQPNAPVSFPPLWDTPYPMHERVQWNHSAPNRPPGDLARNVGEMLGVFGRLDVTSYTTCVGLPCYGNSSFSVARLNRLERLVKSLRSPSWPSGLPDMQIDKSLSQAGERLYRDHCQTCHQVVRKNSPFRRAGDRLWDVGTDPAMATAHYDRLEQRSVATGLLKGRRIGLGAARFDDRSSGRQILDHLIGATMLGLGLGDGRSDEVDRADAPPPFLAADSGQAPPSPLRSYKARSLNGVWATAPYLHNGSVPTLDAMLSRVRPQTFRVGNGAFDPATVGLAENQGGDAFEFDVRLPGNGNEGHWFGVDLTGPEKRALLEYLKGL